MSRSRQLPDGPQVRLSSVAWAAAYTWRGRVSEWGQLLFASRGMLTVHTEAGLWVVPVHQAVWVPAGVRHDVEVAGGVAMRSLHLHPSVRGRLPETCRVIEISPLLREILRRAMRLRTLDRRIAAERRLLDVLLDELTVLPLVPLDLPIPRDARAGAGGGVHPGGAVGAAHAGRGRPRGGGQPADPGAPVPERDGVAVRRLAAAGAAAPRPATARRGGDGRRRRARRRLREHQRLRRRLPPRPGDHAGALLQEGGRRRRKLRACNRSQRSPRRRSS